MTTNMRPATAVKSARAPTFRFRSKALFEHIAGPLQAGAANLTLNKAPRVRRSWRLPAPQFLPLLLQGVAGGFLDLAHALLKPPSTLSAAPSARSLSSPVSLPI